MSQWHRDFPHLAGSSADPWYAIESYRKVAPMSEVERDQLRADRERLSDVEALKKVVREKPE